MSMMVIENVAYLYTAPNGRYHISDDRWRYLDERGASYSTKADAMRAAHHAGYTHIIDNTYYGDGKTKRIPIRYRDEPSREELISSIRRLTR